MKKSEYIIRQGDVLIVKVDKLPEAEIVKPVGNNNLLALGEASGHAHAVRKDHSIQYHANDNMLEVAKKYGINDTRSVAYGLRIVVDNAKLLHGTPTKNFTAPHDPDHDAINLPAGDYLVIMPKEYSDEDEFIPIAD